MNGKNNNKKKKTAKERKRMSSWTIKARKSQAKTNEIDDDGDDDGDNAAIETNGQRNHCHKFSTFFFAFDSKSTVGDETEEENIEPNETETTEKYSTFSHWIDAKKRENVRTPLCTGQKSNHKNEMR